MRKKPHLKVLGGTTPRPRGRRGKPRDLLTPTARPSADKKPYIGILSFQKAFRKGVSCVNVGARTGAARVRPRQARPSRMTPRDFTSERDATGRSRLVAGTWPDHAAHRGAVGDGGWGRCSESVVGADVLGGPPSAQDVRQSDLMRRAGRARGTRAPPRGTAPPQDEISPCNNLEIHCGLPRGSLGGLRRGEKQKRTRPRFLSSLACQDLHPRAKRAWRATRPSAWRA